MPVLKNVSFTGKIGNVVCYKRNGKYCYRMMPGHVKQSKATKVRSTNFGIAAKAAARLRSQLTPVLPFPDDRIMQINFVGALAKWLGREVIADIQPTEDVPFVSNFQFNNRTNITERFRVSIVTTHPSENLFEVSFPAFVPDRSIAAPANTVSVDCNVAIAGCNLKEGIATGSYSVALNFPFNDEKIPAQIISLPLKTGAGNLVVISMQLQFNILKNGIIKKNANVAFMPAGVIRAEYC
jgi:hypothetical protein